MVILEQDQETKLKTPAQEKLMFQLLQSKVLSKKEFEAFYQKVLNSVVTSFDASICLSHLLAVIRFRKRFFSEKSRAHAKCSICGKRENLVRIFDRDKGKQFFMCINCDFDLDEAKSEIGSEKSAVEQFEETGFNNMECVKISEQAANGR